VRGQRLQDDHGTLRMKAFVCRWLSRASLSPSLLSVCALPRPGVSACSALSLPVCLSVSGGVCACCWVHGTVVVLCAFGRAGSSIKCQIIHQHHRLLSLLHLHPPLTSLRLFFASLPPFRYRSDAACASRMVRAGVCLVVGRRSGPSASRQCSQSAARGQCRHSRRPACGRVARCARAARPLYGHRRACKGQQSGGQSGRCQRRESQRRIRRRPCRSLCSRRSVLFEQHGGQRFVGHGLERRDNEFCAARQSVGPPQAHSPARFGLAFGSRPGPVLVRTRPQCADRTRRRAIHSVAGPGQSAAVADPPARASGV
jgi:hypothetical protein